MGHVYMAVKNKKQPRQTITDQPTPDECGDIDAKDRAKPLPSTTAKRATPRNHKRENAFEFTKQLDATQLYLNEIGFSPLLTPEEEVYFARLAQKGDPAGRKRMIESNLRLVVKIARR